MPIPKRNLPTYAIVELLIRLAVHDASIGNYKNHSVYTNGVKVKTSGGSIIFSESLIMQQFNDPRKITDDMLAKAASSFKAAELVHNKV